MVRRLLLSLFVGLSFTALAPAQQAFRYRWTQGQVLTIRATQETTASDTVEAGTVSTNIKLNLTKRWQVLEVDAAGVATLQLTIAALRQEITQPDEKVIVFDSAKPDPNQPELNQELSRYVGQPIATIRLDGYGRLVEVKESKYGPASRLAADLPFKVVFPDAAIAAGQTWERPFEVKLEPPQGAGEAFQATQQYTLKSNENGIAVIALTTTLKTQPEAVADRIPLLSMLHNGEVTFDVTNGKYKGAKTRVEQELTGHNGVGSKYKLLCTYSEEVE